MSEPAALRFGAFELNSIAGELRRQGDLVKLAPQPLKVLELLVRRSGEVVTRNEIRDHVWSGDTFVDFEQGLNFCIRQIREVARRHGRRAAVHRDAAAARLPVPDAGRSPAASSRQHVTRLMVLPFRMLRSDPETDFLAFSLPDARDRLARRAEVARRPFEHGRLSLRERCRRSEEDRGGSGCRRDRERHAASCGR